MSEQHCQIKILAHDAMADWNTYVSKHPNHSPYHLWGWLESVHRAYGHKIIALAAYNDEQIVGLLPLVAMKTLGFKLEHCSLPFCDAGGVLANNEKIQEQLIAYAQTLAETESAAITELRMQQERVEDASLLTGNKVSMLMTLPKTPDELMAGFKSKLRSQIRKSEKNGLTYELGRTTQFIEQFYQVFCHNMHRLGSPVHSKLWFQSVCEAYGENCIIALVKSENKVVGAGLILYTGNKVCIPWASTLAEYNRLAPNMLVYWALLKYSVEYGCQVFDFGRSTYGEGTFKFKQQWGAEAHRLQWLKLSNDSSQESVQSEVKNSGQLRQLVENIWRIMPLGIANKIGPVLRKHISL